MPVCSTAAEGNEMDNSFEAPDQEAQHAPPIPRLVFDSEHPQIVDEDPEVLACWIAAQQVNGVETRILELRLIRDTVAPRHL